MPISDNYDPERPKNLRSLEACTCRICHVSKAKLQEAKRMKKQRGRPLAQPLEDKGIIFKVCGNCFAKMYCGCTHSQELCKSRRKKVENIGSLISSPVSTERLASRISVPGTSLSTLGSRPRKVPAKKTEKRSKTISGEDVSQMQIHLGLSTRRTLALARGVRQATGSRKSIESGVKDFLHEKHHKLDDYFELKQLNYIQLQQGGNKHFGQWTVFCNNLNAFIDFVCQERGLNDDPVLKIGIDGGGGFLKIC